MDNNKLHARCVIEALAKGTAPALLRYPAANCRARHSWWDALEAAVQAEPGLAVGQRGWEGRVTTDADLRSQRLVVVRIGSEQPGSGSPWIMCGKQVQRQLAGAHAHLSARAWYCCARPERTPAEAGLLVAPKSHLRAIKLCIVADGGSE